MRPLAEIEAGDEQGPASPGRAATPEALPSTFERRGAYLARWGPARTGPGRCPVNKKLCFAATDREVLVRELAALATRPECYFVKYAAEPRDGMYLGRAFFVDEDLLGRLWAEYKSHAHLLCSVQDDDWTGRFRGD